MTDASYQPPAYGPDQPRDPTAVMGRRILAWVIDLLLYLGLLLALFTAFAEYVEVPASLGVADVCDLVRASDPTGDTVSSCLDVSEIPIEGLEDRVFVTSADENAIQSLASLGYLVFFVVLQGVTGGSPGKLMTGLRVVDERGQRAGVGRSLVRTLLWVVDGAPWFLPLVGFIVGLTSTGHRRVGDIVARTYVVSARDRGRPVHPHEAQAPAGAQAWGSSPPTPAWQDPAQAVPPASATPRPPSTAPPTGPSRVREPVPRVAPGEAVDPAVPESVVPDISGVPGESPAPPSTAGVSAPPEWYDITGGRDETPSAPPTEEPPPVDPPTAESTVPSDEATMPADEAAPETGADPEWWSGPEAASQHPPPTARDWPPTAPGDGEAISGEDPTARVGGEQRWTPPTTPNADFDTAADTSPTAGPRPFVAPGTDPAAETPTTPQATPTPPPQWDEARNTYIQWDPHQQMWLQWDTAANRWKIIDT